MKKTIQLFITILISFLFYTVSQAADKVVVVPLGGGPKVKFEEEKRHLSIAGNTFTPVLYDNNTVDYSTYTPSPHILPLGGTDSWNGHGVSHDTNGEFKSFQAPIDLPQGASIGYISASICVQPANPDTDHDINLELWQTDMSTGSQTTIRSYNITEPKCNTLQPDEDPLLLQERIVDNELYAYHVRVTGLEGGTCTAGILGSWDCDDRRAFLQYLRLSYGIETVKPQ